MNFVSVEVVRVRIRVAHDHFADLMQEMAQIRTAAGLGAQGIVLDDIYEYPEYANIGRLPDSESSIRSTERVQ